MIESMLELYDNAFAHTVDSVITDIISAGLYSMDKALAACEEVDLIEEIDTEH